MSGLAQRLISRRIETGSSLRDVAAACGVSFSTLSRIERDDVAVRPSIERRVRAWLGDDVGPDPDIGIDRAEELGRAIIRGAAAEIAKLIAAGDFDRGRAAGLREAVAVIRASSTIDRDGTVTTGTADLEIILAHAAEVEGVK